MGCCCCWKKRDSTGLDDESTYLTVSFSSSSVVVPDAAPAFVPRRLFPGAEPPPPFDPMRSSVEWNHPDGITVGETTVATIRLCRRNGSPYEMKRTDRFSHNIQHEDTSVTVNSIMEPPSGLSGHTSIRVSYTARRKGVYTLVFRLNGERIRSQAYRRQYIAGPPVNGRTTIHNLSNHMIIRCGVYTTITISPRDAYGNIAHISPILLHMLVRKGGPRGDPVLPDCVPIEHYDESKLDIQVKLDEPGYYIGVLKYEETVIGLRNCIIICLTDAGMQKVEQNKNTDFLNIEYKAKLMPVHFNEDIRNVKCYISPRQFQIRESAMLIFSKRVFTCRVCNSTKITFDEDPGKFTVDDGLQSAVTLVSEFREIIVATFYSFIQKNSGGAESFQDKQKHFRTLIRQANPTIQSSNNRTTTVVNVRRYDLLESAMYATRNFSPAMWKSKFHVQFQGEAGIDVGGVTREFFTCICDTLFGGRSQTGLFRRFNDDPQGLVHPSAKDQRHPSLGVQAFEFAGHIVGKCLFDSAIENPLFVKAHFTRSFLALLIGHRISWKHFETDDPDLYRFKIDEIRNSDISELDLSLRFTDEVYDRKLSSPMEVSLTPGGSKKRVTDHNKMDYLNELAQHRLVKSVTEEVRAFVKGLKDLIPEDSLIMFDENELELLMCGVQRLDFQDLRRHTTVRDRTPGFLQSVEWFWTTVAEFSPDELARLVQFVTGSSQVPPGGFSELQPPFLLASSGAEYNRLPYAHTCFNHLCLPNYDTYELFRRSLMTAINEGSEGILLS